MVVYVSGSTRCRLSSRIRHLGLSGKDERHTGFFSEDSFLYLRTCVRGTKAGCASRTPKAARGVPQSKIFQSGTGTYCNSKAAMNCRNPKYIKAARDSPQSEIY